MCINLSSPFRSSVSLVLASSSLRSSTSPCLVRFSSSMGSQYHQRLLSFPLDNDFRLKHEIAPEFEPETASVFFPKQQWNPTAITKPNYASKRLIPHAVIDL